MLLVLHLRRGSQHAAGVMRGSRNRIGVNERDLKARVLEFEAGRKPNDAAADHYRVPAHARTPIACATTLKSAITCSATCVAEPVLCASLNARTMATPAIPVPASSRTSAGWTSPMATMGSCESSTSCKYPSNPMGLRPESLVGVGRNGPAPTSSTLYAQA